MTGQFFISLLSPAVTLLLAVAFFVLWYHRRDRYILLAATGFGTCALAFVFQDIAPLPDWRTGRLLTNGLFCTAILCACAAFIARYKVRAPVRTWAVMVAAGSVGLTWYLYAEPRLDARIYVVNGMLAGIVLATVVALRSALPQRNIVDRLILLLGVTALTSLVLRPVLVLWDSASYQNYDGFQNSVYWTTVQFTAAILSVAIALTLLVAVTLELIAELQVESRTDQLSGVLNRRGFEEAAGVALAACVSAGRPSVMIMADLDHFKSINDTYGHAVGDAVIASFARVLQTTVDGAAVVGRVGGEEFAVFLPGGTLQAARVFVGAVRVGYLAKSVHGVPHDARLTASFGIHTHAVGDGLHDLMRHSDKALYAAKHDGRDRVNVANVQLRSVPAAK